MTYSAVEGDYSLFQFLDFLALNYRADNLVLDGEPMDTPWGKSSIEEQEDEDSEVYILVGFSLPDGVYAEIDGQTYGELQGFRIYKNPA